MESVVIIGSGNVAEALARAIRASSSYTLVQIVARNVERGEYLASMCNCAFTNELSGVEVADVYLIAVSDSAIGEVARSINFGNGVVAHTAGSVDIDVLGESVAEKAVFYPLQSFTAGIDVDFRKIPLLIEGATPRAMATIGKLARELSASVHEVLSPRRAAIHLAAVFAGNFTNYMYIVAEELLGSNGFDFQIIKPLVEECARKALTSQSPRLTQTGPASRGDVTTQRLHLRMLGGKRHLRKMYKLISTNIWETLRKRS